MDNNMKKITEIDGTEMLHRTGEIPWESYPHQKRLKQACFKQAFSKPQQEFLKKLGYAARPHPKHNPTIEVFVNDEQMTERDRLMLLLLF